MVERRRERRLRTLRSGKIIFNDRRSTIDCLVRNLSDGGTCLEVNNTIAIPSAFELRIDGGDEVHSCQTVWASENRLGIAFRSPPGLADSKQQNSNVSVGSVVPHAKQQESQRSDFVRGELITVWAALDKVPIGIVLLDHESRAQFINRAFRKMWRLTDAKADAKLPFIALMYYGRDTRRMRSRLVIWMLTSPRASNM